MLNIWISGRNKVFLLNHSIFTHKQFWKWTFRRLSFSVEKYSAFLAFSSYKVEVNLQPASHTVTAGDIGTIDPWTRKICIDGWKFKWNKEDTVIPLFSICRLFAILLSTDLLFLSRIKNIWCNKKLFNRISCEKVLEKISLFIQLPKTNQNSNFLILTK